MWLMVKKMGAETGQQRLQCMPVAQRRRLRTRNVHAKSVIFGKKSLLTTKKRASLKVLSSKLEIEKYFLLI
jgi:hypothetical protein